MNALNTASLSLTVLIPLAIDKTPNPNDVKPGWLAFGVFLALCVAVVLLALSMRKHLRRVTFDEGGKPSDKSSDKAGGKAGGKTERDGGTTTTDGDQQPKP